LEKMFIKIKYGQHKLTQKTELEQFLQISLFFCAVPCKLNHYLQLVE